MTVSLQTVPGRNHFMEQQLCGRVFPELGRVGGSPVRRMHAMDAQVHHAQPPVCIVPLAGLVVFTLLRGTVSRTSFVWSHEAHVSIFWFTWTAVVMMSPWCSHSDNVSVVPCLLFCHRHGNAEDGHICIIDTVPRTQPSQTCITECSVAWFSLRTCDLYSSQEVTAWSSCDSHNPCVMFGWHNFFQVWIYAHLPLICRLLRKQSVHGTGVR